MSGCGYRVFQNPLVSLVRLISSCKRGPSLRNKSDHPAQIPPKAHVSPYGPRGHNGSPAPCFAEPPPRVKQRKAKYFLKGKPELRSAGFYYQTQNMYFYNSDNSGF